MDRESIKLMVESYKKLKADKKAEEKAKRDAEKKKKHREEVLKSRRKRATERRKVVMYKLHLKREKKWRKKQNTKQRRRRINHKYYIKHRRRPFIRRRLHKGDENGRFIVFFTKNRQYTKTYAWYNWKFNSMEAFDKLVKINHEKTICPVLYEKKSHITKNEPVKCEIVVKRKIDPTIENNESMFRDDIGTSVTVKTDDPEWVIIAKDNWYTEEDFYLYGYHPKYDRKDARWIIDNVIRNYVKNNGICRIFVWKSYLFIENDSDFTFVLTKAHPEAIRLYNILYDKLSETENLYFTGELSKLSVHMWIDKIIEKTGWSEKTIRSCNPVV